MTVIQNDDMIQTVAAQSSDESLHEWVLPGTSRCTEDLLDPHGGVKPTRWTNNCAARLRASRASRSCVAPDREDEAWKLRSSPTPPRVVSSPAPLVGLLRCGHCGAGMTQASGKSGRYRYYKCTTRLNKNVDACTAKNLPREQTDDMVLGALSERVFTPKRVSLMLNELLRHQQQAKMAEDASLIT